MVGDTEQPSVERCVEPWHQKVLHRARLAGGVIVAVTALDQRCGARRCSTRAADSQHEHRYRDCAGAGPGTFTDTFTDTFTKTVDKTSPFCIEASAQPGRSLMT